MDDVKDLYIEFKQWYNKIKRRITVTIPLSFGVTNYNGSDANIDDTNSLHEFADFKERLLDGLDNEVSSTQLAERKQKMIDLLNGLLTHFAIHPNFANHIDPDLTVKQRVGAIKYLNATQVHNEGKGITLSLMNQIRYLHNLLMVLRNELINGYIDPVSNAENISQTNKKGKSKPAIEKVDPLSLIHEIRWNEVKDYETILIDKITRWKEQSHGALAECAAFCDYLHGKHFFKTGKRERVKNGMLFAFNKYGINITTQLEKTSKEREPKRKEIERILKHG